MNKCVNLVIEHILKFKMQREYNNILYCLVDKKKDSFCTLSFLNICNIEQVDNIKKHHVDYKVAYSLIR